MQHSWGPKHWHVHVASFSCLQMSFHPKASMKIWPCRWDTVGSWLTGAVQTPGVPHPTRSFNSSFIRKVPSILSSFNSSCATAANSNRQAFWYNKDSLIICRVSLANICRWFGQTKAFHKRYLNSSDVVNIRIKSLLHGPSWAGQFQTSRFPTNADLAMLWIQLFKLRIRSQNQVVVLPLRIYKSPSAPC